MKKSVVFLVVLALIGAFWATAALAEGWRVGDFTDQAFVTDLGKAVKANEGEPVSVKEPASKKSGEKTLLPLTLPEEARGYNG